MREIITFCIHCMQSKNQKIEMEFLDNDTLKCPQCECVQTIREELNEKTDTDRTVLYRPSDE
jgi:hypothetical protein